MKPLLAAALAVLVSTPAMAGTWGWQALGEHRLNCQIAARIRVDNCLDSELSAASCFRVAKLQYEECVGPGPETVHYSAYRHVSRRAAFTCVDQQARDLRLLWGTGCVHCSH